MNSKLESKKGISLIVLVITIIVIIILAVAVILSISNNNPIENARKARFLNDLKTIQEEITLHIANEYANKYETYNPNKDGKIQDIINKYEDYKEKITTEDGKVVLIDDETKVSDEEKKWAEENGIKAVVIPTIPVGFVHTEGTVDTGYVIQNETDKNEFVWVPVKDFSKFERESFTSIELNKTEYTEPYEGTGADTSEKIEYEAMKNSVQKYKGFYIARYEASNNNGLAQSKKGQSPWSDTIQWGTSMTDLSGGAVEKARAVYPDSASKTEGSAVSTLCYGVQWDATIRWLKKNYPTITEDSTNYGNHFNSTFKYIDIDGTTKTKEKDSYIKVPTGSSEHNKTNNIYDMGGNIMEWTMESYSNNIRVIRGGFCNSNGKPYSISYRFDTAPPTFAGYDIGFRFALYIK